MRKPNKVQMAIAEREGWQSSFRRSMVRVGFQLHLTRAMLDYLCAVSDDVQWDRSLYPNIAAPDNFIATSASLLKRGLIERKPQSEIDSRKRPSMDHLWEFNCYILSPAGEHVVALLKLAGVFVESDVAINKKARRA